MIADYNRLFVSPKYRIIKYIIIPLVIWGLCAACGFIFGDPGFMLGFGMMVVLMGCYLSDTIMDFLIFGGIAAKDAAQIEMIKASPIWEKAMRRMFAGDTITRFIWVALVVFGGNAIMLGFSAYPSVGFACVFAFIQCFVVIIVSNISLMIARHIDYFQTSYIIKAGFSVIAVLAGVGLLFLIETAQLGLWIWVIFAGVVVLAILTSILLNRHMINCFKKCFIDR